VIKYYRYCGQDRTDILQLIKNQNYKRVLDIGYSANNWSAPVVTHYIDIIDTQCDKIKFIGDLNCPEVWDAIAQDVLINGPFDFCISSHVLEDIVNPSFVSRMVSKYCLAGFIACPSKFIESSKNIEGPYRGFIHHRYIFNIENDKLIGYPKLNFIEYDFRFDQLSNILTSDNVDLQLLWADEINLEIINSNYMGPTVTAVISYYDTLF
jgi:hypothetical protein